MYTVPGIYRIRFHIRERFDKYENRREFILIAHMKDGVKDGFAIVFNKNGSPASCEFAFRNDSIVRGSWLADKHKHELWDLMDWCGEPKLSVADSDFECLSGYMKSGNMANTPLIPCVFFKFLLRGVNWNYFIDSKA